ncbi:MAG: DUF460 domain-containing protein [Candidatus Marsarchaeota archaeon]|nr:DUF460 domain-containing protein [Candidatus Marsarchaeota archaeon]
MTHIIVGIDPGKRSAIACVDLDGNVLYLDSKAHAGINWFVKSINSVGTPSIIATDRRRISDTIRHINSIFNARIYAPNTDMTIEEKRMLSIKISAKNQHEIDAYAACIKAYNHYINKLNQAEHQMRIYGLENIDEVKAKILNKYSINEAIYNKKSNRR